ncbi:basic amino acid ABC transporter substrate-binding protein [Halopiger djelfimassiliensis]|uniref:basic amino acid ABC transporter substrate-binding protein n=1 Tax=Halopiger djelfimassiliensis TaxID=1293047 RepID=UPI000678021D|nr:basic amino acid ABC transporter substrate-binding protein [Halopiger djelfimassiliensis]
MQDDGNTFDRRQYLKLSGVAGITVTGLAGCLEGSGDGDGDDDGPEATGENEIIAGTEPGFPPFEMVEDGELVGFDIDHLEAVVDETDYELAGWQELEFDSLIPALENGKIDVIAAAMTINEDRKQRIAFSDPYYSSDQSVLVQSGGGFQPSALEDLADKQIGAQSGTTGEAIVQENLIDEGLIDATDYDSYDSYVLAVQDLERGLRDAVVLDQPVARTFEANRDVEAAFTFETGEEYGLGVRQGDEDLQAALNDGIAAVEESGEYETLTQDWFGE